MAISFYRLQKHRIVAKRVKGLRHFASKVTVNASIAAGLRETQDLRPSLVKVEPRQEAFQGSIPLPEADFHPGYGYRLARGPLLRQLFSHCSRITSTGLMQGADSIGLEQCQSRRGDLQRDGFGLLEDLIE